MGKVTITPFDESDPIFREGARPYTPITIRQRLQMMKADMAADDHESGGDQSEAVKVEPATTRTTDEP